MNETTADPDVRPLRERLADLRLEACEADEAGERLYRARLTDGLPVVPPVAGRIAAQLDGADPRAAATSQPIPPGFATPTLWEVAACAVLAGCQPGALPLIVTALEALVQPEFNLLGVQTTTGAAAPLLIVNGPVARALDLNAGPNALGPGWRSNATIGRAVRLALQNIGLCFPGEADMATHGHPGKFSWLVVEHEAASPWPPFHRARGFAPDESAVTVAAAVGNVEVVLPTTTPAQLVMTLAHSMALAGNRGAGGTLGSGQPVVLLPPESAQFLARHGWDRGRLQRELFAAGGLPLSLLADDPDSKPGNRNAGVHPAPQKLPLARSPGDIFVVVTGGVGIKATFLPTWGGGATAVSRGVVRLPR